MQRAIPILVGGAVAVYVWRNRYGEAPLRNAGLTYRSVGERGEPYPDWVRALTDKSGVYVIREIGDDGTAEVVYVGESHTNRLYNTLTRHFQRWRRWKGFWRGQYGEGHDPGLTYDRSRVEVAARSTRSRQRVLKIGGA